MVGGLGGPFGYLPCPPPKFSGKKLFDGWCAVRLMEQFIKQTGCEGNGVVVVDRRDRVVDVLRELAEGAGDLVVGVEERRSCILFPRGRLEVRVYADGEDMAGRACGFMWRWIGFEHPAVDDLMLRYAATRCRDRRGRDCFLDGRPVVELVST